MPFFCELGAGCQEPWLFRVGLGSKGSEHIGPKVGAVHIPVLAQQVHTPACLLLYFWTFLKQASLSAPSPFQPPNLALSPEGGAGELWRQLTEQRLLRM